MKQISINNHEFNKNLGHKLKALRKKAGLSQGEFGNKMGFSSSGHISLIENGARGLTVENLYRASQILGVPPTELIAPIAIPDEQVAVYRDIMTIFSEPIDPNTINLVKSFLKLAASHKSSKKLEKKINELESMGINVEHLIDGILKSRKE